MAPLSARVASVSVCFSFAKFLFTVIFAHTLTNVLNALADDYEEYLVCRQCGHNIVKSSDLVKVTSSLAYRQWNETIHGPKDVLIQLFKNPDGIYFEVITSSRADVLKVDKAHREDSWFPGFSWTISVCPRCGFHLGWSFESIDSNTVHGKKGGFVGLILHHLLHQLYADSLIMTPKLYTS